MKLWQSRSADLGGTLKAGAVWILDKLTTLLMYGTVRRIRLTPSIILLIWPLFAGLAAPANLTQVFAQSDAAQNLATQQQEDSNASIADSDVAQLDAMLTRLVLDAMPLNYVDDRDWGKQKERWDGLRFRFDDGRLETKRRKKKVNHGTWERYSVSLDDPENSFSVRLENFDDSEIERPSFDILVRADTNIEARQSKWLKGVQLYSISATGSCSFQLKISVALGSSMDLAKFPPDLILDPEVTDANIEILDLRIDRVSKAGGEFAQQVTRLLRNKVGQKIASKEDKLVEKMNRKLDENSDRFRLSVHDAIQSRWAPLARSLVREDPAEEKQMP